MMVACINSPTGVIACGEVPAVEELEMMLKKKNFVAKRLKADAAYHSHYMQPFTDLHLIWMQKSIKAE